VFTKSTIVSRDLELHKQYKDNSFIVWSITTCDENIRRIIEPGTPPASAMFAVIKKFSDSGIRCAVNIDPIIPLVTDSPNDIESILDNCLKAGVGYVFGAILRLRADIWERMKSILMLLNMKDRIKEYSRIFHFTEPVRSGYNIAADQSYSNGILEKLGEAVHRRGISFDFPNLIGIRCVEKYKLSNNVKQLTLMNYM
jgi:DNA repair photolyase